MRALGFRVCFYVFCGGVIFFDLCVLETRLVSFRCCRAGAPLR